MNQKVSIEYTKAKCLVVKLGEQSVVHCRTTIATESGADRTLKLQLFFVLAFTLLLAIFLLLLFEMFIHYENYKLIHK